MRSTDRPASNIQNKTRKQITSNFKTHNNDSKHLHKDPKKRCKKKLGSNEEQETFETIISTIENSDSLKFHYSDIRNRNLKNIKLILTMR